MMLSNAEGQTADSACLGLTLTHDRWRTASTSREPLLPWLDVLRQQHPLFRPGESVISALLIAVAMLIIAEAILLQVVLAHNATVVTRVARKSAGDIHPIVNYPHEPDGHPKAPAGSCCYPHRRSTA